MIQGGKEMKKRKICLLFLLLISLLIVSNVTADAAPVDGKTVGEVGFIDGSKKKDEPKEIPNIDSPKKRISGLLPKTGEELFVYVSILGLVCIVGVVFILIKRKKKNGY